MPTKPVTPAVNNDTFRDSDDNDLSDIKITCSFNFDEVVTRQSAPPPDARSSDTRFSDFEREKPALVKSISREENWARLFGIITASAAAVVSPVIMIGAVFWTIGIYKNMDSFVMIEDETMRKIFWFDSDLNPGDDIGEKIEELKRNIDEEEKKLKEHHEIDSSERLNSSLNVKGNTAEEGVVKVQKNSNEDENADADEEVFENYTNITLETCLKNVHLNEALRLFYYDEAFIKAYQEAHGDIDLQFTTEEVLSKNHHKRAIAFKTLTKSYFGPTYADAVKRSELIIFKSGACMSHVTKLANIPYANAFEVHERHIILKERDGLRLTMSYDIIFLKNVSVESIIRKKTESQIRELSDDFRRRVNEVLPKQQKENIEAKSSQVSEDSYQSGTDSIEVDLLGNVIFR
eukprot:CAMPEP_0116057858 /NCGR_PEP_ID=MMETSP0322-20121206/4858_1 /TAXON_ID=163516 /ORGANISM="Leptocylindrus danicus var. apora, Strain B651" /LENGTH=404 /DNA_ID=CAMNT_0003541943 /DNA_START=150 /DNA_END=1364 /DNA_ORIENTATION=-